MKIRFCLIRGTCQIPVYVAHEMGFFRERGLDSHVDLVPAAWMVPSRILNADCEFGVLPWTRVAIAQEKSEPLVVVAGSGMEEAELVIRADKLLHQVQTIAVPQPGGVKDILVAELIDRLGWHNVRLVRNPSGDAAMVTFIGNGADAISTVEPFGTMFEMLGLGKIGIRVGSVFPGVPGCCLTSSRQFVNENASTVHLVVQAIHQAQLFIEANRGKAAHLSQFYIGVSSEIIEKSLDSSRPSIFGIRNHEVINQMLDTMCRTNYLKTHPQQTFIDFDFIDALI